MENEIGNSEYDRLLQSIRQKYGYDFSDYADVSVKRRILYFMNNHSIHEIATLEKKLLGDEAIFEQFVQGLSVTVTEMFRDPGFYRSIRENVIKRLATYPVVRVWIAGCATGEEAYSIAIMLKEEGLLERSIVYATDINQRSLQVAKDGIYSIEWMQKYTENYMRAGGKSSFSDHYIARYNNVLFDKTLKQRIVFSPHNLSVDRSFNEFHLILCRNVLMYFNQSLQNKVIRLLHESLVTFGFLGLGDKESLLFADKKEAFEAIDYKHKLFRKVS